MVVYQTIAALVNQIPVDTWDVLREIKERSPAIMLSELINCRDTRVSTIRAPGTRIARAADRWKCSTRNEELGPLRAVAPDGGST